MLFATTIAFSHHSFAAEYDAAKPITIKGTITKIDLVNPHSWLYIDVKDSDGKVVNWAIEMGSPNNLIRRGVTKNSVPVGTEVTVDGYRAKDGSATVNGTTIKMPDGKRLFAGSSAPDAPGGEK
jgi:outer membrane usher protein FimD/PapC